MWRISADLTRVPFPEAQPAGGAPRT